jgi:hypothetical protein
MMLLFIVQVLDKKFIILCETAGDKSSVEAGSAAVSRV